LYFRIFCDRKKDLGIISTDAFQVQKQYMGSVHFGIYTNVASPKERICAFAAENDLLREIELYYFSGPSEGGPRGPAPDREYRKAGGPRKLIIVVLIFSPVGYMLRTFYVRHSLH
jgi:hypothetical protein